MTRRFKTVRELICWEYAKLIAGSAFGNREEFRFVQHTYDGLLRGQIDPSTILRENQLLFAEGDHCVYCSSTQRLEWDHVIPKARGGPDSFDNLVRACGPCNRAKGVRDPYRWQAEGHGAEVPRIALGKLLKLCLEAYEKAGLIDDPVFFSQHTITRANLCSVFEGGRFTET